jgi:hypothetical protein
MQKKTAPSTQAIITAGEAVAIKVYKAFFGEQKYTPKLCYAAAGKMTQLKKIVRPLYAHTDDVQMLHALAAYSVQDILEAFAFSNAKEGICNENQPKRIGQLMAHSTETESHQNPNR